MLTCAPNTEFCYRHHHFTIHRPEDEPELKALIVEIAQESTDLEGKATKQCGESRKEKFANLLAFMWTVVGTRRQRLLLLSSSAFNFVSTLVTSIEQYYQQSVLYTAVTELATKTAGQQTDNISSVRTVGGLKRVVLLLVLLRTWGSLLSKLAWSMREQAYREVRESLAEKLTRHVLAQDLEDVEKSEGIVSTLGLPFLLTHVPRSIVYIHIYIYIYLYK